MGRRYKYYRENNGVKRPLVYGERRIKNRTPEDWDSGDKGSRSRFASEIQNVLDLRSSVCFSDVSKAFLSKWHMSILFLLIQEGGSLKFTELEARFDGSISTSTLNRALNNMDTLGLIKRSIRGRRSNRVVEALHSYSDWGTLWRVFKTFDTRSIKLDCESELLRIEAITALVNGRYAAQCLLEIYYHDGSIENDRMALDENLCRGRSFRNRDVIKRASNFPEDIWLTCFTLPGTKAMSNQRCNYQKIKTTLNTLVHNGLLNLSGSSYSISLLGGQYVDLLLILRSTYFKILKSKMS